MPFNKTSQMELIIIIITVLTIFFSALLPHSASLQLPLMQPSLQHQGNFISFLISSSLSLSLSLFLSLFVDWVVHCVLHYYEQKMHTSFLSHQSQGSLDSLSSRYCKNMKQKEFNLLESSLLSFCHSFLYTFFLGKYRLKNMELEISQHSRRRRNTFQVRINKLFLLDLSS